jgi:hypothetical protein
MKRTLIMGAIVAACVAAAAPAMAATVTPEGGNGWITPFDARVTATALPVPHDTLRGGAGATGEASLRLTTGPGSPTPVDNVGKGGRSLIGYEPSANRPLADLTALSFKTFLTAAQLAKSPSTNIGINIPLDLDGTDGPDTLDTILVWEAYRSGPGNPNDDFPNQWHEWDAFNGSTGWWSTRPLSNPPADQTGANCLGNPQNCTFSLAAFKAAYPNAKILGPGREAPNPNTDPLGQPYPGGVTIVTGSTSNNPGWENFVGFIDDVKIGLQGTTTAFDFEQAEPALVRVSPNAPNGWVLSTLNNGPNPPVPSTGEITVEAPPGGAALGGSAFRLRNGLGDPDATTPPYPVGSGGMAKVYLPEVAGRKLAELSALSYRTWISPDSVAGPAVAPTLKLQVWLDGDSGYSTLTFEPYMQGGHPERGTWQTWDALNGTWWGTGASSPCPQASPCPLTELLAAKPNATIIDAIPVEAGGSGLEITVGQARKDPGGWDGLDAYVDDVVVGFGGLGATRYDFEDNAPEPPAPQPVDSDLDGIEDAADCAPLDPTAPSKIGTDADCDGIPDELQQGGGGPRPQPQPQPQPGEPSTNPPADGPGEPSANPTPPARPLEDRAQQVLRDREPAVDEDFDLGAARVFVPTGGPTRRVPSVDDDTVTIDRRAVRRGTPQTLLAIAAPDADVRAIVRLTVTIGGKQRTLPVQRLTLKAGSAVPVKLPLTRAMRRALSNGQDVQLTVAITVVDARGNRTTETKTFTLEAAPKPKRGTRG